MIENENKKETLLTVSLLTLAPTALPIPALVNMPARIQTRLAAVVCEGAPARCRCALCVGHGGYHASRPRQQSEVSSIFHGPSTRMLG